ncbi:hypothetical protein IKQ26_08720 [bacterium]|nr:hypothetical protein [bacterium]
MFDISQDTIDEQIYRAQKLLRLHQNVIYSDVKDIQKSYRTLPELLQKNVFVGSINYGNNIIA